MRSPCEGKELLHEGEFAYEFLVVQDGQAEVTRGGEHIAGENLRSTAEQRHPLAQG